MSDFEAYIKSQLDPSLFRGSGKFEPKLSFHERCQILGLIKIGVHRYVVAEMFGVSRPTVGYITRPNSPHYGKVRDEFNSLGREAFLKEYIDHDLLQRVEKFKKLAVVKATDAQIGEIRKHDAEAIVESKGPNKNADKFEGQFQMFIPMTNTTYLVDIRWLEDEEARTFGGQGTGWHVFIKSDGEWKIVEDIDRGFDNYTTNWNTSQQAHKFVLRLHVGEVWSPGNE